MTGRDIFTFGFFGRAPTLADLLVAIPEKIASRIVEAEVTSEEDIKAAVEKLTEQQRKAKFEHANLVRHGVRMEKALVEELAQENGVSFAGTDHSAEIIDALINKVGIERAHELVDKKLAPHEIEPRGAISEFDTPSFDFANFDAASFVLAMEPAIEQLLSKGAKDTRKVKVRAEIVDGKLLVGIYFQRPDKDGRDIESGDKGKKVLVRSFKQGAGSTYFAIKPYKNRSRVILPSPGSSLSLKIKSALGQVAWKNAAMVPDKPATAFRLDVFKAHNFVPGVAPAYATEVEGVALSEINIRASTQNILTVKSPGKRGDALSDFRIISDGADVFVRDSKIESVMIKFFPIKDRRKILAKARVFPDKIQVDDQRWDFVLAHLRIWGVADE